MKRTIWLILISILLVQAVCTEHAYAQEDVVKALQDSLQTANTAQRRVDILNNIAISSFEYDISLSQAAAEDAKNLADSIAYLKGVADANRWLGKIYNSKGKTPESLGFFMAALTTYEELKDSVQLADIYKNLANVYSNNGNSREAMRYYNTAMSIYKSIKDRRGEGAILNNIGTVYLSLGNADSGLFYLDQSRLSGIEIQDHSLLATSYLNMGFAYAIKEDFNTAIDYYTKSYDIASEHNSKETMSTALLNIGDSYMNLGRYDMAEASIEEGLLISETEGYIYNNYVGYYTLGEINEKRGDYRVSLDWFHRAEEINEELTSAATINALMDVQTSQLEAAQDREIDRINILNEERIEKERVKNLLFLSLAILALVVLLGITYYYKRQHSNLLKIAAQNQEINLQKEQIEEQSTKIRQVNSILSQRNKRLRELNEDKSFMMSVVAHDLKSPLNQIRGLANVIKLEDNNLTETQKECLDNIDKSSSRLRNLIDKILEGRNANKLSKNLNVESVDIDKMAVDVINDFATVASSKNISLQAINNKNGSKVRADKHYLRQVLDNLLSNAIKFSPPGKEVELILNDEGNSVVATVQDHGPGIDENEKDKLFKEYAVLSAKPTGNESSTGLGLAIAKNYVEQMGGKIWCESEKGQGASFKVSLAKA